MMSILAPSFASPGILPVQARLDLGRANIRS